MLVGFQGQKILEARLEYRHDEANRKAFGTSNDRLQKGQDTIMVEFAYLL